MPNEIEKDAVEITNEAQEITKKDYFHDKTPRYSTVYVPVRKFSKAKDENGNTLVDENGKEVLFKTKERPAMTPVRNENNEIVKDENGKALMQELKYKNGEKAGQTVMISPRTAITLDSGDFEKHNDGRVQVYIPAGQVKPLSEKQEKWLRDTMTKEGRKYEEHMVVIMPKNKTFDYTVVKDNGNDKDITVFYDKMTPDQLRFNVDERHEQLWYNPITEKTRSQVVALNKEKNLSKDADMSEAMVVEDIVSRESKGMTNGK